jgi:hypothetical protein
MLIQATLRNWFKLGILEAFALSVGKVAVNVQSSSKRLTKLLILLFAKTAASPNQAHGR